MTLKDGPSEGTWSVFAEKVAAERDAAIAERDALRRELDRIANNERIESDGMHSLELEHAAVLADRRAIEAERDAALACSKNAEDTVHLWKNHAATISVQLNQIIKENVELRRIFAELHKMKNESSVAWMDTSRNIITHLLNEAERRAKVPE